MSSTSPRAIAESLNELWSPRIVGELDDSYVKVAKVHGTFGWHDHALEDELFFILKGRLRIEMHGCYPNCAIKKKRSGLWLTSIRLIEQGEELLIDYDFDLGEEFDPCKCGHPRCRGLMLRKKDWPKLRRIMSKISKKSY